MMKRFLSLLTALLILSACTQNDTYVKPEVNSVYYEIFVGSFYDSDDDGMGDLEGVRQKLDYIQYDLGATGIWLMPISPSPTYHKYDVMDYKGIDSAYGSMEDFENLVEDMNERGMDLILDLVLNHSSEEHPWFKEAVAVKKSDTCEAVASCDYYNFSNTYQKGYHKIQDNLYYEGGFWSGMPDLNLDNESLKEILLDSAKFWLDKGVKGFRLDATTHFFDNQHEANVEFLKWFNDSVKSYKPDTYIVAEAWSHEGLVQDMYRSGVDSFFNFKLSQDSGSIVKSIKTAQGYKLAQTVEAYNDKLKVNNPNALDAPFLSNHDNNRSAGYLVDIEDQKLAASIYLLLPGHPFIYYGEEIGLRGSGIDENKRLPMIWDKKDDTGLTKGPVDANYKGKQEESVKEALKDKNSLLNHYKKVIAIRNAYPQLTQGEFQSVDLNNDAIYASLSDDILIIHNLSDTNQIFQVEYDKIVSINGKYIKKDKKIELGPKGTILIEKR